MTDSPGEECALIDSAGPAWLPHRPHAGRLP